MFAQVLHIAREVNDGQVQLELIRLDWEGILGQLACRLSSSARYSHRLGFERQICHCR